MYEHNYIFMNTGKWTASHRALGPWRTVLHPWCPRVQRCGDQRSCVGCPWSCAWNRANASHDPHYTGRKHHRCTREGPGRVAGTETGWTVRLENGIWPWSAGPCPFWGRWCTVGGCRRGTWSDGRVALSTEWAGSPCWCRRYSHSCICRWSCRTPARTGSQRLWSGWMWAKLPRVARPRTSSATHPPPAGPYPWRHTSNRGKLARDRQAWRLHALYIYLYLTHLCVYWSIYV